MSSVVPAAAITHAPYSGRISFVAILGTVDLRIILDFSRIGALVLTATPRMIRPAPLLALVVPTMKLSSAHKKPPLTTSVHVEMQKLRLNLSTRVYCTCDHVTKFLGYYY